MSFGFAKQVFNNALENTRAWRTSPERFSRESGCNIKFLLVFIHQSLVRSLISYSYTNHIFVHQSYSNTNLLFVHQFLITPISYWYTNRSFVHQSLVRTPISYSFLLFIYLLSYSYPNLSFFSFSYPPLPRSNFIRGILRKSQRDLTPRR